MTLRGSPGTPFGKKKTNERRVKHPEGKEPLYNPGTHQLRKVGDNKYVPFPIEPKKKPSMRHLPQQQMAPVVDNSQPVFLPNSKESMKPDYVIPLGDSIEKGVAVNGCVPPRVSEQVLPIEYPIIELRIEWPGYEKEILSGSVEARRGQRITTGLVINAVSKMIEAFSNRVREKKLKFQGGRLLEIWDLSKFSGVSIMRITQLRHLGNARYQVCLGMLTSK